MPLIEHQERASCAVTAVTACTLDLVIKAQYCRSRVLAHRVAHGGNTRFERGKYMCCSHLARGQRMTTKPHFGDYTQSPLAAHEELSDLRSGCGCGVRPVRRYRSICADHLKTGHHLADRAVTRGVLAGAVACNPSANC
jgi:hypothetical protein